MSFRQIDVSRSPIRRCDTCANHRVRFTYAVTLSGPKPAHLCTNCVDVLRRGILQAKRVQSPREKRAVQPQHAPKSKVREF